MKTILRDLYYGQIVPWERKPVRTEEYLEIHRKIEEVNQYFMQKMSMDDCERFQSLENLYGLSSSDEQFDAFSYGFQLGVALMCAALLDENGSAFEGKN